MPMLFRPLLFLPLLIPLALRAQSPDFPTPTNNQEETIPLTPPAKTIEMMHLPPGFKASLYASEPDVQQPIAMCWDERGRLWVAENYTYSDAKERFDMKLRDRILIFEDTKNTGHFDKRTVFYDNLQMLTSIERGFGGVYALCPPYLYFIPTKDDKPTGPPQVVLDGFSTTASSRHTFANGLKWGPDGWLYGRIGISSTSWIDVPGTPQEKRQPTAGGIWRYHPIRKVFEPYCHGTTNPWGMDWDQHDELFFINTVIGHFWHGIHGAHFKRMHGEDPYSHVYDLIDQHADHYHWDTGKKWNETRDSKGLTDTLGGGHAHVGMMIYQGINWPKQYRGGVFTLNLHGHRINEDILEQVGSGYVAHHGQDFMKTDDPWFRSVEIQYGPDGGVYILDWCDIGECHEADGVHRTSGRIYKITYGDAVRPAETDLTKLSAAELVKQEFSDNEWLARMARWELRERAWQGGSMEGVMDGLKELQAKGNPLRYLSTLTALKEGTSPHESVSEGSVTITSGGSLTLKGTNTFKINFNSPLSKDVTEAAHKCFAQPAKSETNEDTLLWKIEHAWADTLLFAEHDNTTAADEPKVMAQVRQIEPFRTPRIRLAIATLLPYLTEPSRVEVAGQLLAESSDAGDHNLPLMYWFGIRDLSPAQLAKLFENCHIGIDRQLITRRVTEDIEKDPASLNNILKFAAANAKDEAIAADVLAGMEAGLKGWRKAKKPSDWDSFAAIINSGKNAALQANARDLNVLFGDGRALDQVTRLALDNNADMEARRAALQTLIDAKAPDLRKVCEAVLNQPTLGATAIQGMTAFDDPALANKIVGRYNGLYPHERSTAIAALVSRPSFAKVLLTAMKAGKIPHNAVTPAFARQIRSFNNAELTKQLTDAWGESRESNEDTKKLITTLKAKLTPAFLAKGDPSQGRVIFSTVCATCHRLYGEGHDIGPDLTGSGRHDVNYLIENIADPSAIVAADFRMSVITLKDGRVLNGIIHGQSERTITVRMIGQEVTVERNEIAKQEQLAISMMPEGLLTAFTDDQVRNLVSYLMTNAQVPMPSGTGGSESGAKTTSAATK